MYSLEKRHVLAHWVVNSNVSIGRHDTDCQIQFTHPVQRTVPRQRVVVERGMLGVLLGLKAFGP